MSSRVDILKVLKAEAIQPVKLTDQLGDNFPATGGCAELLRAFRGTQPLLIKNRLKRRLSCSMLTISCPSACILGPVFKLELQLDGNETELAIEIPSCTCSVVSQRT